MRTGLAWLLATTCAAGIEVGVTPTGTIDLEVKAAPVLSILDCLALRTGMKVINDGAVMPRQPVTLSLRDRTEVQAIYGLFEGLGLNYALSMDRSGRRVVLLLLSGAAGTAAPRMPPPPAPAPETMLGAAESSAQAEEEAQARQVSPPPPLGFSIPQTPPARPSAWPGGPPSQPGSLPVPQGGLPPQPASPDSPIQPGATPDELFPEQRPLTPLSLRDAGRVRAVAERLPANQHLSWSQRFPTTSGASLAVGRSVAESRRDRCSGTWLDRRDASKGAAPRSG